MDPIMMDEITNTFTDTMAARLIPPVKNNKLYTTDGTFTVPAGVEYVFLLGCGGDGGAGGSVGVLNHILNIKSLTMPTVRGGNGGKGGRGNNGNGGESVAGSDGGIGSNGFLAVLW